MYRYPFRKLAAIGIGIGVCVGCSDTPQELTPTAVNASQVPLAVESNQETNTPALAHSIILDTAISINADIGSLDVDSRTPNTKGFELNIDQVELTNPIEHGLMPPCQVEFLTLVAISGAQPVDIEWFDGADSTYELLIDIIEPEFKTTIGQLFQASTGMVEADISDRVQTGQDYLLEIEFFNTEHGEVCLADGLVRFDPVDEFYP